MEFLSTLLYFIIAVGILVVVHEFGHFIAARMTGTRADIFSVGMGNRLFGWNKKTGFTFWKLPDDWESDGYTDYRLSMFPIGGYVKVAGMIDESMDTDFAASEPQPWEFRSKNAFQKIFIMSAGVLMNAILAIIIFGGIAFFEGKPIYETTTVGYVQKNSIASKIGFETNDKVISINGKEVTNWTQLLEYLALSDFGKFREIVVLRNGQNITLKADGDELVKSLGREDAIGLHPLEMRTTLGGVESLKPAGKAGMQLNDTIITINNIPITYKNQIVDILQDYKNKPVFIQWKRGDKVLSDTVTPDKDGRIGIMIDVAFIGKKGIQEFNVIEATTFGVNESYKTIDLFVASIVQMFKGNLSVEKNLGGPIIIAKTAAKQAENGLSSFLTFMALLSITLAVINILPVPALDGGHVLMTLIEAIIRREIPLKIKIAVQQFGLILLLALMAYLVYVDIMRL